MYNFKRLIYSLRLFLVYIFGNPKIYWATEKAKSRIRILGDLFLWFLKEGEFNTLYFAYKLNHKGARISDYISKGKLFRIKTKAEKLLKEYNNYSKIKIEILTKDKFYCTSVLKANNIQVVNNMALIINHKIINISSCHKEFADLGQFEDSDYFVKNVNKESGEGVFNFTIKKGDIIAGNCTCSTKEFFNNLKEGIWVIQKKYTSHSKIRSINDSALNTTRIYTIMSTSGPVYFGGYQAFATNGARIDSWSHGSVYVGIDAEKDTLGEFGITSLSDKRPGIMFEHPDSLIKFKDYEIPHLKDSVELCLKAHNLFYCNFFIGWDVAITDEGPLIVEANEFPGINVLQCFDGGIRKRFLDKYNEVIKYYGPK